MLFMVIENFRGDARPVYDRFRDKGRLLPPGLDYCGSWVAADFSRCFQLMQCDDVAVLQQWVSAWSDLVEFEIVPVLSGQDAAKVFTGNDGEGEGS